jgi:two-component system sensor histidine kinase KdpD
LSFPTRVHPRSWTSGHRFSHGQSVIRVQACPICLAASTNCAQYELSRALANAAEITQIGDAVVTHTEKLQAGRVVIFSDADGSLQPLASSKEVTITEHEQAVAAWAYERGQPAGHGTDTLTGAKGLYLPLQGSQQVIGVLGLPGRPPDPA